MTVSIQQVMTTSPVMPVMVINRLELAVPLAQALVNGDLKVLEITLRTPVALDAIRLIKNEVPGAIVGAGTIINTLNLRIKLLKVGAEFIVSPGVTESLLDAALAFRPAYFCLAW